MQVLVTGATGFLGAHIVHALLGEGHSVRALVHSERPVAHLKLEGVELVQGDLHDDRSLKNACRAMDAVIHAAARLGFWSRQDAEQRRTNVEGTSALLRAAAKQGLSRIVHISSVAAVGASLSGEILDESAPWQKHYGDVHYALSKRQAEERALVAAGHGAPIIVVNPSALFGPRLDRPGPTGMAAAQLAGRTGRVPPGGVSVADVEDVARAIVAALDQGRTGERYILAGHNLSFESLQRELHELLGGPPPRRVTSRSTLRVLHLGASLLDNLRLSRPRWAPELFLAGAFDAWYSSAKAQSELGYNIRPLRDILLRSADRPTS